MWTGIQISDVIGNKMEPNAYKVTLKALQEKIMSVICYS